MKLSLLLAICLWMAFVSSPLLAGDENYDALKAKIPPVIDGDLSEWVKYHVEGIYIDKWEPLGGTSKGKDDISVTWYALWDDDNLYFAADVSDDEHLNTQVGNAIWNGDAIQIAIDPTGKRVQFDGNSFEYNFGLGAGDKVTISRLFSNPKSKGNNPEVMVVRDESKKKTYYELRIPAGDIAPAEFKPGSKIGFAMIVNDGDKDAPGQKGWVGWGSNAIVFGKDATQMNILTFSGKFLTVNPEGKLASSWGKIKTR